MEYNTNHDIFKKTHANPFNWVGSKHRYIKEFLSVLPEENNIKVLDVFTGGGDLISKLPTSWDITANDAMKEVYGLHTAIQQGIITSKLIQEMYDDRCMSKTNKQAFLDLRKEYNKTKDITLLYLLMTNSFNNQLRFNLNGEFNMPFGKDRSFNKNMKAKLDNYSIALKERNVCFLNKDYKDLDFNYYYLLILDPPYSNTTATYNESSGWSEKDDLILFDKIEQSGKKFIYFNQVVAKGVKNNSLSNWMSKYNVIELKNTTQNCNHQRKGGLTIEVMVYN